MATERDLELLDDYLANRMQGEAKSAFENQLKADPTLQSEMVMQQRLVKAIKDARVAELKKMLNNTPVPPVSYGGSAVMKFAAGSIVAGLIATGVYLYFDRNNTAAVAEEEIKLAEKEAAEDEHMLGSESATEKNTAKEEEKTSSTETAKTNTSATSETTKPALEVYDPSAEIEEIEEPADERRSPARAGAPSINVQVEKSNDQFSYQFKEGRLMLFGPFEKNLYEILEFFSAEKRTVFLYYKNNYYLLKDDSEDIQELRQVTDPALIKKLREYQKK